MKKVLPDENLPVKLKFRLESVCEIYTVKDKGWNALKNGELLCAMQQENVDYLITSDKNLQYQQNLEAYTIGFIVLNAADNTYESFLPLVDKIKQVLYNEATVKLTVIE